MQNQFFTPKNHQTIAIQQKGIRGTEITQLPINKSISLNKLDKNLVETSYYLEGPHNGQIAHMNNSEINDPDVIFVLNLDIGPEIKEKIVFKDTDTPEELASNFCRENNLNIRVYDFVANALREKYDEVTLMKYI